jgi:eukaryotic-like serine/threonine-protein kinase
MAARDFSKEPTLPDLVSTETRPPPMPAKIGPYRIESLLSKGGMSYVYLGIHPQTLQPIVIKVLSPKYQTHHEMVQRFLKEAAVIGMTNHPNIVKLYGQGTWEKGFYIAIEFIQGVSLRQFIQQKSLSEKRALEIVLQVAYALCHLHTHGVIHRDIKPENVLITENGEVKVIDFGIAQVQGDDFSPQPTKRMIGTPMYMSPEQKENPLNVSYTSDIYSLGMIAYELLLGRLSYGIIHLALLPKDLRSIIEKALNPNPKERYQDIVDFITDISHYLKTTEETKQTTAPEEMTLLIEHTRQLLLPKHPPTWSPVDIGLSIHGGSAITGLYIDWFKLPKNCFCFLAAEPRETGVSALLQSSIFRGMARMAVEQGFRAGKTLAQVLGDLNYTLTEDPACKPCRLSALILSPDTNQLGFISCGYSPLWHVPDGNKNVRPLTTANEALGIKRNGPILEIVDNWNSGDTLIFHSFDNAPTPDAWLSEHLFLAPQPMATKIVEHLAGGQTAFALCLQRIY